MSHWPATGVHSMYNCGVWWVLWASIASGKALEGPWQYLQVQQLGDQVGAWPESIVCTHSAAGPSCRFQCRTEADVHTHTHTQWQRPWPARVRANSGLALAAGALIMCVFLWVQGLTTFAHIAVEANDKSQARGVQVHIWRSLHWACAQGSDGSHGNLACCLIVLVQHRGWGCCQCRFQEPEAGYQT